MIYQKIAPTLSFKKPEKEIKGFESIKTGTDTGCQLPLIEL
ncbi:MAG: hypothetical protein UT46_C0018G0001, partial [Candidatus Levybacteria bacterium GW2011_GWA1_39_34]